MDAGTLGTAEARRVGGRRRGRGSAAAALAAAALACAGADGGGDRGLRVEASQRVVRDASEAAFVVRNGTDEPVVLPDPADAFVLLSAASGEGRVIPCATAPIPPPDVRFVTLGPGETIPLRVDVAARCAPLGGDARLTVRFSVPPAMRERPGGREAWTGSTRPARVQILPAASR